jgi:putative drug exporter of the RND superfamily
MFDRLGRLVLRFRFVFLAGWIVAAIGFGVLGPSLSKVGSADETSFLPKDAESLAARNLIATAFPNDSAPAQALIVFSRPGGVTAADRAAIEAMRGWFQSGANSGSILRYVTAEGSPQLASMYRSSDGTVELARVDMSSPSFLPATNAAVDAIRAHLAAAGVLPAGLVGQVSGQAGIGRDYLKAIQDGTDRTTIVTVFLVVLVLLLIYRAPLAALVPLMTIGAAFMVSRGTLGFLAQGGWKLSSVLDSFIVVLVFGVGTDYTIFLISRFREELGRHEHDEAVRTTVARISAVITASAATVIVGLTSMLAAQFGMIQTTGPALAITIFITLLAGLTLTPSLLAIFGRRLFWPLHEQTRTARDESAGFWAALSRRITARPGRLAAGVLIVLFIPLFALPQIKQNFDLLQELPASAESRVGFETLSAHFPQGQLMPLTVLVDVPAGGMTSQTAMTRIASLESSLAALPDVQSVRSVVDPLAEGKVSDLVKPQAQLTQAATGFRKPPSTDINVQLGDTSLNNLKSLSSYLTGLAKASPGIAGTAALTGAEADLATLEGGIASTRPAALVSNQLSGIAAQVGAAASSGASPTDKAAQLLSLSAYLKELGAAHPEIASQASFLGIQTAFTALTVNPSDTAAGLQLIGSIRDLAAWFSSQPAPVYFAPTTVAPTAASVALSQAMAAARLRLPGEFDALAGSFSATDLYASPDLAAAYTSADGHVVRLYVTTVTNPYDTKAFDTVRQMRTMLAGKAADFGAGTTVFLGGATAEFTDVQTTISADFVRVAVITILGILVVLILLLRAITAPVYLVLTVLLSFAGSLSLSALILQRVFGEAGINYFIPLMVFVLLVALGSDYNIFLMSRVREESANRPLREGIRVASARTGTVITSAGLILAGTFGALITSPLQLLFQVGVTVALGVLIDTFIIRSLLVPAITAVIGERAWWPFHRRDAA